MDGGNQSDRLPIRKRRRVILSGSKTFGRSTLRAQQWAGSQLERDLAALYGGDNRMDTIFSSHFVSAILDMLLNRAGGNVKDNCHVLGRFSHCYPLKHFALAGRQKYSQLSISLFGKPARRSLSDGNRPKVNTRYNGATQLRKLG